MTVRVDKLEADVRKAVRLGYITAASSIVSLALKMAPQPAAHAPPAAPPNSPATASGNTVTIGDAAPAAAPRDFKTVSEFAEIAGLAPRTITAYIAEGRIHPQPVKSGREWVIPENSRILPHSAEDSSKQPQTP
jgi:hypothetical protein